MHDLGVGGFVGGITAQATHSVWTEILELVTEPVVVSTGHGFLVFLPQKSMCELRCGRIHTLESRTTHSILPRRVVMLQKVGDS